MKAKAESRCVREAAHDHFGGCVLAPHAAHEVTALFRCQSVHHKSRATFCKFRRHEHVNPVVAHWPINEKGCIGILFGLAP